MAGSREDKGKSILVIPVDPVVAWPTDEGTSGSTSGAVGTEELLCSGIPVSLVIHPDEGTSSSTSGAVSTEEFLRSGIPVSPVNHPVGADERTSGSSEAELGSNKRKRFEITKWQPVAYWSWDVAHENCAICRNHLMELCIECEAALCGALCLPADQEACTAVWGACNHAFHVHCIQRWLKTRSVCPLDNSEWEFLKIV